MNLQTRPRGWRTVGVGGGGALFHPTISPHDPNVVAMGCDMTGSFVTEDGGRRWRAFHLRAPASCFAFDPEDPATLYAGAVGLWRSRDLGRCWELLLPAPASIERVRQDADEAGVHYIVDGGDFGSVQTVSLGPGSRRLLVTVQRGPDVVLLTSADGGATWVLVGRIQGETLRTLHVGPGEGCCLSLFTDRSLWTGPADGLRRRSDLPPTDLPEFLWSESAAAGVDAATGATVLYHLTRKTISVSRDGGGTWEDSRLPGSDHRFRAIGAAPTRPEVAFVAYAGTDVHGAPSFGRARTVDGGRTWTLIDAARGRRAPEGFRVDDDWIADSYGAHYGGVPIAFGAEPVDPRRWWATSQGCAWKTEDAGARWEQVYFQRVTDRSVTTSGVDVTTCAGVFHDPFDAQRLFIPYGDIGLCRSEDGGGSWMSSIEGVPRAWENTTYWLAFDPEVRGRVWGCMSWHHDLPRTKMYRKAGPVSYRGGVCVSEDGGRTWRACTDGMPDVAPTHIVLDPRSPAGARRLYVAAFGTGVYRSVDSGAHWSLANHGITEEHPFAWRLVQDPGGVLYLVVFRRHQAVAGALYRSGDGADSWERVSLPAGGDGPSGLCVDAGDPARLYLASWRRPGPEAWAGGGIWVSDDAGRHWENVLDGDQHLYDVTQDPNHPEVLYAAGFESNLWRSADRGETWSRVPGFDFRWGHRVTVDPVDPEMIYVATFGGGVWHGPATGSQTEGV